MLHRGILSTNQRLSQGDVGRPCSTDLAACAIPSHMVARREHRTELIKPRVHVFTKGEIVEGSVLLVLIEDEIQLVFSEGHPGRDPRHAS